MIALAAPFGISALVLVLGAIGARLVRHEAEARFRSQFQELSDKRKRNTAQAFLPENLGDTIDWAVDGATVTSAFVGPIAGFFVVKPLSDLGNAAIWATWGNLAGFVLTLGMLVYVITYKNPADWRLKYRLRGWLSPVVLWGIIGNSALAALILVVAGVVTFPAA